MRSLEAICVTSQDVSRRQIRFSEETGLIEEVGNLGIKSPDYTFSDDCLLFAGMGDIHIHAREDVTGKNNYKEDFSSAYEAMKNGGLTHAGDMPNNPLPPVDDKSYEDKFRLAVEKAHGDLWLYAGVGPQTRPLSYPVPYKVYMGPSVGDLYFKDLKSLEEVLVHYQGQEVSFHCEDPVILEEAKSQTQHHLKRPPLAEVMATKDALYLIEKYRLKGKLCHYSTAVGLELIKKARQRGVDVKIEVTPQHLYFDLDHLQALEFKKFQMNPPIRSSEDRKAMLTAFKDGHIDFLATDHAPHTQEEKDQGISGLTGLDTYGPFVCWLIEQGVDPKTIALATAENPGSFFNKFLSTWRRFTPDLSPRGYLLPDYAANFTVLDKKQSHLVETKNLKTKVKHSPFTGHIFPGSIGALFIRGKRQV